MRPRLIKTIFTAIIAMALVLNLPLDTEAAGLDRRLAKPSFGIKLGFLNSSTITITSKETGEKKKYVWSAGFIGGPFFDINVTRAIKFTISAELQDVQWFHDREKLLDISGGFKTTIYFPHKQMALRPGFAIGYGYLAQVGDVDKMTAMTTKIFVEGVFLGNPKYSLVTDFGLGWIPQANSLDFKIRSNPYLFIRAGVML